MSDIEHSLRHQVAAVSLLLNAENILGYSGHISVRIPGTDNFLIQPVDQRAAGEFDVLVARLLERVANRDQRPRWKESSFFKRFAN